MLPPLSWFALIILLWTVVRVKCAADRLLLVTTLARHGDRTPSHTFPNDPYVHLWTQGMEQLTDLGSEQHVQLGRFIRQRYIDFLPMLYHKDLIYVRSTATERTLMSAYSCMAGLFPSPPSANKNTPPGDTGLSHQLIPVHSVFKPYDQLLKMSSPCPVYKRLWRAYQTSAPFLAECSRHADLFAALARVVGQANITINQVWQICDPVVIWDIHRMKLPDWTTPQVVAGCQAVRNYKHTVHFSTPEFRRYRGGPFVRHLIAELKARASAETSRQLTSYFAHDSTLAAVMSHLGVFNSLIPPLASCVFVELWSSGGSAGGDEHFVRVYFRNDSARAPMLLTIPGCEEDCGLTRLARLFANTSPQDINEACALTSGDDGRVGGKIGDQATPGPTVFVMVLIGLVGLEFLLLVRCYLRSGADSQKRNLRSD